MWPLAFTHLEMPLLSSSVVATVVAFAVAVAVAVVVVAPLQCANKKEAEMPQCCGSNNDCISITRWSGCGLWP